MVILPSSDLVATSVSIVGGSSLWSVLSDNSDSTYVIFGASGIAEVACTPLIPNGTGTATVRYTSDWPLHVPIPSDFIQFDLYVGTSLVATFTDAQSGGTFRNATFTVPWTAGIPVKLKMTNLNVAPNLRASMVRALVTDPVTFTATPPYSAINVQSNTVVWGATMTAAPKTSVVGYQPRDNDYGDNRFMGNNPDDIIRSAYDALPSLPGPVIKVHATDYDDCLAGGICSLTGYWIAGHASVFVEGRRYWVDVAPKPRNWSSGYGGNN